MKQDGADPEGANPPGPPRKERSTDVILAYVLAPEQASPASAERPVIRMPFRKYYGFPLWNLPDSHLPGSTRFRIPASRSGPQSAASAPGARPARCLSFIDRPRRPRSSTRSWAPASAPSRDATIPMSAVTSSTCRR